MGKRKALASSSAPARSGWYRYHDPYSDDTRSGTESGTDSASEGTIRHCPNSAPTVLQGRGFYGGFPRPALENGMEWGRVETAIRGWLEPENQDESVIQDAIRMFDKKHLETLGNMRNLEWPEGIPDPDHWRYRLRRHLARLLGWREKRYEGDEEGIPPPVNKVIRKMWPDDPPANSQTSPSSFLRFFSRRHSRAPIFSITENSIVAMSSTEDSGSLGSDSVPTDSSMDWADNILDTASIESSDNETPKSATCMLSPPPAISQQAIPASTSKGKEEHVPDPVPTITLDKTLPIPIPLFSGPVGGYFDFGVSSQSPMLSHGLTPKAKRTYTKRNSAYWESFSQPRTPAQDRLPLPVVPISTPSPLLPFSQSPEQPPSPPTKKREDYDVGQCSKDEVKGGLHRPLWDCHWDSIPEHMQDKLRFRPDITTGLAAFGMLAELDAYGIDSQPADSASQPGIDPLSQLSGWDSIPILGGTQSAEKGKRKFPAAKRRPRSQLLQRETICRRPHTRSMSKIQRVHVPADNFSPVDAAEFVKPGSDHAVGELLEIFSNPELKIDMVRVHFGGSYEPMHFIANQVIIMPLVDVLPKIEYSDGCVCCLPNGEEDLPAESSPSDNDFNSLCDPLPATMLEQFVEDDLLWEGMTPDETADFHGADNYFRYSEDLPFERKFHDVHWLRGYEGQFRSSRAWLGDNVNGVPSMGKKWLPGEIFEQFFPLSTWVRIVKETNRYAKQKERKNWSALTVAELKCWLGICILMGIKKLPELAMHWNKSHPVLINHFMSDLMPRDRWLDIMAMLHLVDNTKITTNKESAEYDKIIKIRWLVDDVCSKFRAFKPVDRFLSVDEMMIKCLARRCPIKQYNKDKPDPHGMKVWALVSATTRYIYALEFFCGAQSGLGSAPTRRQAVAQTPQDKATYKVVMHLMQFVPSGLGHVVTMDNYFTGIPLFIDLLRRHIFCTGTARPGIIGWPSSMTWNKKLKGNRGDLRWRMHVSREIGSCVWYDKKPVAILSSYALPWEPNTRVDRREGAAVVSYPTSPSLLSYVKLMRGVDIADQIRAGYSVSRKGRRWWKRGLFFVIDSALCNAWVVGCQMWKDEGPKEWPFFNHLAFNIALADSLVVDWKAIREKRREIRPASEVRLAHAPSRSSTISRACVECGRRTYWRCEVCSRSPHICIVPGRSCYQTWHQKKRRYL